MKKAGERSMFLSITLFCDAFTQEENELKSMLNEIQ